MSIIDSFDFFNDDPGAFATLLDTARRGDMDAQYVTGLLYVEGRGMKVDLVQAYFWLTRACEQGDSDARELRQWVASRMKREELTQADHLLQVSSEGLPAPVVGTGALAVPAVLH